MGATVWASSPPIEHRDVRIRSVTVIELA
jgi:hypothetical protein